MKLRILLMISLLTALTFVSGADIVAQAGNETITTTTILATPSKLVWIPSNIKQEIIDEIEPEQSFITGRVTLKNGLEIESIIIRNTDNIYVSYDLTGSSIGLIETAKTTFPENFYSYENNIITIKIDKQTSQDEVYEYIARSLTGLANIKARQTVTTTTIPSKDEVPDNTRLI